MLAGMVLGFFLATAALVVFRVDAFPYLVFGGTALGVLLGLLFPQAARSLAERAMHFFIGLFSAPAYGEVEPNRDAPNWLKVLFWLGLVAGLVAMAFIRW
jgi:hypothetical protein